MPNADNLPSLPEREPPGGWPVNQAFDDDEWLYYRIHPESWPEHISDLDIDVFCMPDMSVNRGLYGRPEWILIGYVGWGAVKFLVRHVPPSVTANGVQTYTTKPVHDPLDNRHGYPHTEIRAYLAGVRVGQPQYSPEADIRWRERLVREVKEAIAADREAWKESVATRRKPH